MSQSRVVFYTTATCPYSWEMRDYLQQRAISFVEARVDLYPHIAQELMSLVGDQVVPVTVVWRDHGSPAIVVGFDRQRLDTVLKEEV